MNILETKRLIVKELKVDDKEFIFELMNTEGWLTHIGDRGIKTLDDAAKYIETRLAASYQQHGYGLYKVSLKETNTPIGINGFVKRSYLDDPDIGFGTLPQYERMGYTYEAGIALINYGIKILEFDKVLGITSKENTASQKLLEKLGLLSQGIVITDEDEELLLYSTNI